jgi:sulfatase maturation enzyme AslB (radical SAM superfamily)
MLSKTFCILPWTHAATYTDGTALLCCVAKAQPNHCDLNTQTLKQVWNGHLFKSTRLKMLRGEEVDNCAACYEEEAMGINSHRLVENYIWYKRLGKEYVNNLINNTRQDGSVPHDLITLDLRLGNTCNLQCVMCRPIDSSKWVKHATVLSEELTTDAKYDWQGKIDEFSVKNFEWYKDQEFLDSFYESASGIQHIIFGGGEPLYIKEHKEIIKQLVNRGYSKNIELRYHTNGTIWDQEVADLWTQFKRVEVMISIDGHGKVNDYIRYPSDWATIEKNLQLYDNSPDPIDPKILCTVQALNIAYLPEFADWIQAQNYKKISRRSQEGIFHAGVLHYPLYLSPKVLPKKTKEYITEKLGAYANEHLNNLHIQKFKHLAELMNSEDLEFMLDQTIEYTNKLDSLRNTDSDFFRKLI